MIIFLLATSVAASFMTGTCQANLAIGALSSLSGQDYHGLKKEFYNCHSLYWATTQVKDLEFRSDTLNPQSLQHNLSQVSQIFRQIRPEFEKCSFDMQAKDLD